MEYVENVVATGQAGTGVPARPPVASFVVPADDPRTHRTPGAHPSPAHLPAVPGRTFPLGRRIAYGLTCGLGALGVGWAASAPAGLAVTDPVAWPGFACVVLWAVRSARAVRAGTAPGRRSPAAVLAVPLLAGVVAGAVWLDVPRETRWMQAQGGFENALRALPTAKQWDQQAANRGVPGRIGSFWLDGVTRDASGAVQFLLGDGPPGLASGSGAAFTYLVDGPTRKVREANPGATFSHLHGNWYIVER